MFYWGMADLQATIEFAVELYKFYNVDLFQRGWVETLQFAFFSFTNFLIGGLFIGWGFNYAILVLIEIFNECIFNFF